MQSVLRFWEISKADVDTVIKDANSCIPGIFDDLSPSLTCKDCFVVEIANENSWEDTQKVLLKTLTAIKQPLIQARKKCLDIFLDTGIFVSDLHESITKITLTPALLKLLSELGLLQILTIYNDIEHELTHENVELTSNMPSFYSTSLVFEKTSKDSMDSIISKSETEGEHPMLWTKLFGRAFWSPEQENTYIVPLGGSSDYSKTHEMSWLMIRHAQSVLSLAKQLPCEPHLTFSFNLSENERLLTEVYWSRYFMQELAELNMHLTFQIISDSRSSPGDFIRPHDRYFWSRSIDKLPRKRH